MSSALPRSGKAACQVLLLLTALGAGGACRRRTESLSSEATPALHANRARTDLRATTAGLRVAFLGDQGLGVPAEQALRLVRRRSADLLILLGDFDYENHPTAWLSLLDRTIGDAVPWLAVVGNHDVGAWGGLQGYGELIRIALSRYPDLKCRGTPGRSMSCVFRGLHVVLSDVGTLGSPEQESQFLVQELSQSTALWRVCAWHKNQRDLQVGTKSDEVGWAAYQACQAGGALVVTGHEHSYARTLTLTRLGDRAANHGARGVAERVLVGPGKTFVSVIGTGGMSLRSFDVTLHDEDRWWAAYYTADRELSYSSLRYVNNQIDPAGVLFIEFLGAAEPRRARAWFETARLGRVVDRYEIEAE